MCRSPEAASPHASLFRDQLRLMSEMNARLPLLMAEPFSAVSSAGAAKQNDGASLFMAASIDLMLTHPASPSFGCLCSPSKTGS
jgi:hypothetical protein